MPTVLKTRSFDFACKVALPITSLLLAVGACGGDAPEGSPNAPLSGASSAGSSAGGQSAAGATTGGTTQIGGVGGTGSPAAGASGSTASGGVAASGGAGASAGSGASGGGGSASGGAGNVAGGGGSGGGAGGSGGAGGTPQTCPATALTPGNTNRTLQFGGRTRSYVLRVPAAYTGETPVPLLVDFHGHGGTGESQSKDSPFINVTASDGVLMAFPTAIGDWNMGPCCADDVDDIGFARALVTEIKSLGCVDPKRVYAAGFSMGGAMSHQLACHAADVFAAVAPAAFDLLEEHLPTCKPARPISVITFRGTQDDAALFNGGLSNLVRPIHFLGAINSMKKWAEINGCTGQAMDMGNGCQGFAASQCPGGVESTVCVKNGGGHEQGDGKLGWPVLKRHQLP